MIKFELTKYDGSKITEDTSIYTYGWMEIDGNIYTKEALSNILYDVSLSELDWEKFISRSNGSFLLIIATLTEVILIADRLRSIPLFYYQKKDEYTITDHISIASDFKIDNLLLENFTVSGFVFEEKTIYQNIFQIQAGEIIQIQDKIINRKRYFLFEPLMDDVNINSSVEAVRLDEMIKESVTQVLKSVTDVGNWIVPLSGGHDSRLIANYLRKLNVNNVICFSYGVKGNIQSELSRQVSEKLGYEWYFIESTFDSWENIRKEGILDNYCNYAFNGVSVPHIQDLQAVLELKRRGIITEKDVFLPGHSFDFLAGSHLLKNMQLIKNKNDIKQFINKHYSYWGYTKRSKDIENYVDEIINLSTVNNESFPEFFNWQERQSKFIVNSVRLYEFLGFRWRLPLWDKQLIEFWQNIGFNNRIGRSMYFKFEEQLLCQEIKSIPFDTDINQIKKDDLKRKIIKYIPKFIRIMITNRNSDRISYTNEGLFNAFPESTMEQMLYNKNKFPRPVQKYLKPYLKRPTKYYNFHGLTIAYVINKLYDQCN